MRRLGRHMLLTLMVSALMILGAPAAFAQPPNDDFADATEVGALPFMDTVDTSDATAAPDDPEPTCVETSATVWYSYTATENQFIDADTFGSDYDTTLSVWTGEPGQLEQVACNDDRGGDLQSRVNVEVAAGTTYYFMVGSFDGEAGGNLVFSVDVGAPPAGLREVTIDESGTVRPKTGEATIRGTVVCTGPDTVFLDGFARQRKGRLFIEGFFFDVIECSEGETPWTATITEANGLFTGGRLDVTLFAFSEEEDVFVEASTTVKLRGKK